MSLADHIGEWLPIGDHKCVVTGVEVAKAGKNDNPILRVELTNDLQKKGKADFWLTEKALVRLADFAQACGLTKEEMANYDENNPESHQMLLNRQVIVRVEKPGKYTETTEWCAIDEELPPRRPVQPPPPPEEATMSGINPKEIPF